MKVKDLIQELKKFDSELEVKFETNIIDHTCGDGYCYCTGEDVRFIINSVDKETLSPNIPWYRKRGSKGPTKLKEAIVAIRGERD